MDYLAETLALGVDSIILIACIKQFYKNKNAMMMIQGRVKPLGNPIIKAPNNPNVSGVVQLLRIKEHVIQRSTTGFWADSERMIQEVHNVTPFALEFKGIQIEVCDPLAADVLDMDVISDKFHPTVPSVMDHIWGFLLA
ncbi:hypothetical protein NQ317_010060 [Molorchus minor]|uniref:Uncharacterized protein n=1 Tax=Molorchus minor TaxID=1323400 RepID=A0ABQ9JJ42_9CUCU|nr:hypothetical protein NQ317_010060 [Molorchus minor]